MQIITPESKEAWLELRSHDITSTEAAALFGISPYLTPFELWHRKRDASIITLEENERMVWGKRLEKSIAEGVADDEGLTIRRMDEYVRDEDMRLGASFDFRIRQASGYDTQDDGLLEIKNVDALQLKEKWLFGPDGVEAPAHIEVQVQHQLLVSHLKFAKIRALVGGNRVVKIERTRDETIIEAIKIKSAEFWKSIAEGIEPKPDFSRDSAFIAKLHGFSEPGKVLTTEDPEIIKLVTQYRLAGEDVKAAEKIKEEMKAKLLLKIGDVEKVIGPSWSISAGMIGPKHVEYDAKGYRGFRINVKKEKEVANV